MSAAVLLVVVGLLQTAGPGVLGADASETLLYAPTAPHPAPQRHGRFVDDASGLHLASPPRHADSTALWSTPALHNGLVRARFTVGPSFRAGVLVRAAASTLSPAVVEGSAPVVAADDADTIDEVDGGYSLVVEKGVARLSRFEHRIERLLGIEAKLVPAPKPGSTIEVAILVVGPWLSATIYDGATLKSLAHLEVLDRGFVAGGVGVRMHRSQDAASALTYLSVASTTTTASTTAPDITMDGAGTGAGAERVLTIATSDLPRVPSAARRWLYVDGDVVTLITDPVGVELVQRAGVPVLRHTTQSSFKDADPTLRARLVHPAPTMTKKGPRIDESYKDAAMVEAIVRAWAERYPQLTRLEELGTSLEGRPVLALLISRNAAVDEVEPAVLFDGAHHGGELISTEIVLDVMQQLLEGYGADKELTRFVDTMAIWCVPLVNVDGNHRYVHHTRDHDRKNGRDIDDNGRLDGWDGVDLYRQSPVQWGGLGEVGSRSWPYHWRYRGAGPATEPEVRALVKLAERERFAASIDFHTASTKILVPYTDPSMQNPVDNEAWAIAEAISTTLPVQPNRKRYTVVRNLYPVDGTAQDFFRFAHGTVALLVEAPQHNPLPYAKRRTPNVVGARGIWLGLLRAVAGPSLRVRVVDDSGAPVEAVVTVVEQAPRMGERWTSRPRDGLAVRLRAAPGKATVLVERAGQPAIRRVVDVKD
ncbi:MAG TPA: M14 family zinc carboxypeptidase, partial [Myxococcota bacterium]